MYPSPTPIVRYLLIINAIVFAILVLPAQFGIDSPLDFLNEQFMLVYFTHPDFQPFQLITHFFHHADLSHIFFNMLILYFFGPALEQRLGGKRFLLLYLVAAAGAVALHTSEIWWQVSTSEQALAAFNAEPTLNNFKAFFDGANFAGLSIYGIDVSDIVGQIENNLVLADDPSKVWTEALDIMTRYAGRQEASRMLGASGAISGVMAAYAVFNPWQKLQLLFIPVPIAAVYMIGGIFALDLFMGVMDYSFDTTARFAHLGGGVAGALLAFYFKKTTTEGGDIKRWN
jgi:membrane associated rhomboid family serine protease